MFGRKALKDHIAVLKSRNEVLKKALAEARQELADRDQYIRQLEELLTDPKNNAKFVTQIGPIRILNVRTTVGVDLEMLGMASMLVGIAGQIALKKLIGKTVDIPGLPRTPSLEFDYLDTETGEMYSGVRERAFKKVLVNKHIL